MRRPRPYIPLSVRVQVAERQLSQEVSAGRFPEWKWHAYSGASVGVAASINLARLIEYLSEALGGVLQLDHDPALILRQYKVDRRKPPAAWYTPNANDPDHLIYRPLQEHGEKTFGRKAGAEKTVTTKGSDIWLKTKFRRLESPSKKPRAKIPSRPFGKGRPFPKRRGGK